MRPAAGSIVPILIIVCVASGQTQSSRPTATPTIPTTQPIPRAALDEMYKAELGRLYDPAQADILYRAHALLERYFDSPDDRKQTLKTIESLNIDPNVLGRLARIRMNWPELAGGVYYVNEKINAHDAHYFLGIPKNYDRTKSWPLVIKLPTADAFVGKPPADAEQVKSIYIAWMTEELTRHPDAIVVMPLLHLDELYGPSYA